MKLTIGEGRDEIKFLDGVVLIFPEMVKYRAESFFSLGKFYVFLYFHQYCLMIVDKQGGSDNNQHEYDDLEGTLYVDTMVPRIFRTVGNLHLSLPDGCPKLGIR
uniref:Uncharacterized protein n=1 Tax=Cannabis sativa TaxID=3483 RepID=A0A803Q3D6_CANSA